MSMLNTKKRISAENEFIVADVDVLRDKFIIRNNHLIFLTEGNTNPFRLNNEGHLIVESVNEDDFYINNFGHLIGPVPDSKMKLDIVKKNLYTEEVHHNTIEVSGNPFEENEMMVTNVALALTAEKINIVNGELVYSSPHGNPFSINEEGELIYSTYGENPYYIEDGYLYTTEITDNTILNVTRKNLTTKEITESFIPITEGSESSASVLYYLDELANLFENGE